MVLVLWAWCGVVYWMIEQTGSCRNQAEFPHENGWKNILVSVQHTCLEWAGGKWHTPKTFSGRFFALFWLFARLVILASYTANLASTFISNSIATYTVNSVEEAIARKLPICAPMSTYLGGEDDGRLVRGDLDVGR
eukprot:Tamp_08110.p3 GENE.Tamp_08110~~Tamp_08110.p3  ORF type:complete len:136 (+),score=17.28 Tamp_08110:1515-1922(+)